MTYPTLKDVKLLDVTTAVATPPALAIDFAMRHGLIALPDVWAAMAMENCRGKLWQCNIFFSFFMILLKPRCFCRRNSTSVRSHFVL